MGLGVFKRKVEEGRRFEIETPDGSFFLQIVSARNKAYRRAIARFNDEMERASGNRASRRANVRIGPGETESLLDNLPEIRAIAAKHILIGWEGLIDSTGDFVKKGDPIPYSQEMAEKIFNDPEYEGFYQLVMEYANDEANYQAEKVEDAAGNSSTSSDGISTTEETSPTSSQSKNARGKPLKH